MKPIQKRIDTISRVKKGFVTLVCLLLIGLAASVSPVNAQVRQSQQNYGPWKQGFGPLRVSEPGSQAENSEVAVFRNGRSVVVWEESADIMWRRYSRYGSDLDPVTKADELTGSLANPDVATGQNNWFAITWSDWDPGLVDCGPCLGDMWIRDYWPDGTPYDTSEKLINGEFGGYMEGVPFIAAADTFPWPSGSENITWGVTWQPDEPIYYENVHFNSYPWGGQIRVDQDWSPSWPIGISVTSSGEEFLVMYHLAGTNSLRARKVDRFSNPGTTIYEYDLPLSGVLWVGPRATLNEAGEIGIAWVEGSSESDRDVCFQAYTFTESAITPLGPKQIVASPDGIPKTVAIAPDDWRFAVTWDEVEDLNASLSNVYVRKMYSGFYYPLSPIWVDERTNERDFDPSIEVKSDFAFVSWTKAEIGMSMGDVYIAKVNLGADPY